LKKRKKAIRVRALAAREEIPAAERARRSEAIAERLMGLPEVVAATTVMVFSSFGSEVETGPILRRLASRRVRVLLPRVVEREMHAVPYAPGDRVTRAPFGAEEPSDGEPADPSEIDVVVVPGLAFDLLGHRVGYGGGFYDRFLKRTRRSVLTVGVCFGSQVMDEVPYGGADLPVSFLVTEDEAIECR
jgi:5-formyltetrahydrofolate cyclo-ligase